MFFSLYRQKDIDKIIEGNYWNYVIDKLACHIKENKPIRVPDVVFMNFTSGIFSSKTLVSMSMCKNDKSFAYQKFCT